MRTDGCIPKMLRSIRYWCMIVGRADWEKNSSEFYDRSDAVNCLNLIVTLWKFGFAKQFTNSDLWEFSEDQHNIAHLLEDRDREQIGGMEIVVWT